MINLIKSAKDDIVKIIENAYKKGTDEGIFTSELPCSIMVENPKDRSHGDFATNFCMQAARALKMPPRNIAKEISSRMSFEGTLLSSADIAGPGFINFHLSPMFYQKAVRTIIKEKDGYGRTSFGNNEKIMVEFVSANPTGPMHIGNARGGAIGDCLSSVLSWAGYDVTREFYVNDAGNQIERFFRSLDARYKQALLGENSVEFPEDGYHGDDIKERAEEFIKLYGDKYLNAPEEERKKALVLYALNKNVAALRSDLADYRIHYDNWFFESSLYESGEVEETLNLLKKAGFTYEQDGAIFLAATKFGCEKDEVLVRANGLCTYFAADIAYHRNKFSRGFDRCINIWGADHHGHVARMKGALDAVGLDGSKLDVILMQLVRLVRDGEVVRVSKRSGKSITLRDLLDETGIDAARFFFNLRQHDTHLEFDLNLAVEESSQNPVYYVQYAHARICSILRSAEGIDIENADLSLLAAPEEIELISLLAAFPEEICTAAVSYEPSRITRYTIDLAAAFHKFYGACRVNCEDEMLKCARLALVTAAKITIANALSILSVSAPKQM
jgi:arginyl-tRNA synthetase